MDLEEILDILMKHIPEEQIASRHAAVSEARNGYSNPPESFSAYQKDFGPHLSGPLAVLKAAWLRAMQWWNSRLGPVPTSAPAPI